MSGMTDLLQVTKANQVELLPVFYPKWPMSLLFHRADTKTPVTA